MQNEEGELLLERQARVHANASTAFDISRSGSYLGLATSEGEHPISLTTGMHWVACWQQSIFRADARSVCM